MIVYQTDSLVKGTVPPYSSLRMATRRVSSRRATGGRRRRADGGPASKTAMSRRAKKRQGAGSTRERILTASERLFAEQGFAAATMPMIARASGITAGAIYKHFDGKADLFFEVVRRALEATAVSAVVGEPSATTPLPSVLASYTTRRLKRLRQLAVEVHYASAKDASVRRVLRRSLDQQIGQIGEHLAAEQEAGRLDPAVDAELLACTVLVLSMGLMHMETLLPQLVDDAGWFDFVRERVATVLGVLARDEGRPSV